MEPREQGVPTTATHEQVEGDLPSPSTESFDLLAWRGHRISELNRKVNYLEAENERNIRIIGALLRMSARIQREQLSFLQAAYTRTGDDPNVAAMHQQHPFLRWLEQEDLLPPGTYSGGQDG
jgi:hypothetical protein